LDHVTGHFSLFRGFAIPFVKDYTRFDVNTPLFSEQAIWRPSPLSFPGPSFYDPCDFLEHASNPRASFFFAVVSPFQDPLHSGIPLSHRLKCSLPSLSPDPFCLSRIPATKTLLIFHPHNFVLFPFQKSGSLLPLQWSHPRAFVFLLPVLKPQTGQFAFILSKAPDRKLPSWTLFYCQPPPSLALIGSPVLRLATPCLSLLFEFRYRECFFYRQRMLQQCPLVPFPYLIPKPICFSRRRPDPCPLYTFLRSNVRAFVQPVIQAGSFFVSGVFALGVNKSATAAYAALSAVAPPPGPLYLEWAMCITFPLAPQHSYILPFPLRPPR